MPNKQTSVLKRFVVLLMSGFSLFAKAFRATYHQIWVSGIVLALVTMLFAIALFFAEHSASPDYSFWDALELQASFGIYIPVRTLNTYPRAMEILNRISYKPLLSLLGFVAKLFLIVAIISIDFKVNSHKSIANKLDYLVRFFLRRFLFCTT